VEERYSYREEEKLKKKMLIVLGCAVLLMVSGSAYAAKGWYFGGNIGFATLSDTDMTFPGFDGVVENTKDYWESQGGVFETEYKYSAEFQRGVALSFALGHDFGNHFRVDVEVAYQKNDLDAANFRFYQDVDIVIDEEQIVGEFELVEDEVVSGESLSLAMMVNAYYDFSNKSAFTPFVTAGIGLANVDYDMSSQFINEYVVEYDEDYNLVPLKQSGNETVLAYQLGFGCGYALSEALTLELRYRYFATEDPAFGGIDMEYSSSNVYFGVRYGF
jgi:opacity protein-like surface antigen